MKVKIFSLDNAFYTAHRLNLQFNQTYRPLPVTFLIASL